MIDMIHFLFLVLGVCMALLCHWILRHTYELTTTERRELRNHLMDPTLLKKKRVKMCRGAYILLWAWCILLAPISWFAPIFFGIIINDDDSDCSFIYTNRFIEWCKEEV